MNKTLGFKDTAPCKIKSPQVRALTILNLIAVCANLITSIANDRSRIIFSSKVSSQILLQVLSFRDIPS